MALERVSRKEPEVKISASDLQHPVTQEHFHHQSLLQQRNLAFRGASYVESQKLGVLNQCIDLEARRKKMEMYVKSLGIAEKTSPEEVEVIKKRILTYWENREDIVDAFDDLVAMRAHVYTSHDLLDVSEEHFRRMRAAEALGFADKPTDSWTTDDYNQISDYISRNFMPRVVPFKSTSQRKRYAPRPDNVLEETEQTPWGAAAVDYAHDHETDCLITLYNGLAEETKDKFGVDIETDKPTIYTPEVKTYKDAQRYSRPLPEQLKPLFPKSITERHDIEGMIRYEDDAFYEHPDLLKRKAELFLPVENLAGLLEGETASEAEILAVQRMLYPKILQALEAGTDFYRPNAEEFIISIAASVLTKGIYDGKSYIGYPAKNNEGTGPIKLCGYVPRIQQLAFQNEVDLNPLYEAVKGWKQASAIDNQQLCRSIDTAQAQIREFLRNYNGRAIDRMLSSPTDVPDWKRDIVCNEPKTNWKNQIAKILGELNVPDDWKVHIRQLIFNTGSLTKEGIYESGTGDRILRSRHILDEIKAEIMKIN